MERDNQNYNRSHRDDDHRSNDRNRGQRDEQFENYRDRYSNQRGNYYGMNNDDAAYRNVNSYNSNSEQKWSGRDDQRDFGNRQGSRDSRNSAQEYHYGDPNPYMQNDRNGGYDRTRGTGWRDNNDRNSHYDSHRISDRDTYERQDNSYHYGGEGQGRRYNDFGRDEGRSYNRDRNSGYNRETENSRNRSDNDFRGDSRNPNRNYNQWQDRHNDKEDFRYGGRIQSRNESRDNSRQQRSGQSGPDYSAKSSIGNYGRGEYRG
ncbi:hypothetical protein MKJ04_21080 [Pontibacter sp. E15-1]|uniref:hypothetical protein n=1 Tax=Pontibacter sp. E15-1 TaxID=2919918 RepID=UPI001F4F298D|nr:hypothetical protein [Pontibacter sp. E15-1]MCJ8167348.1 hypothetical protein [Pontibacter sp. E15-1]